jgi:hypothetical protein
LGLGEKRTFMVANRAQKTTKKKTRQGTRKRAAVRMLPRARVAGAVEIMSAPSGAARFDAGKALCVTARKDPERVYPYFDALAALLGSNSKIVRWDAIQLLGLLTPVDVDRKLDAQLDTILAMITGDNLISAANAIQAAGRIAGCRPDLTDRIILGICAVERATYKTPECRNVAIGQALDVFWELGSDVCRRPEVAGFIRRQQKNKRPAVAQQAKKITTELATGGEIIGRGALGMRQTRRTRPAPRAAQ